VTLFHLNNNRRLSNQKIEVFIMKKNRIIAFYLPQFHPTETNNEFYGTGFTEWTNVCSARPLFPGHKQPNIPADLGFYDLRLEDSRIAQAEMAKKYGIEGFCYYYYRFNKNHRELDLPYNQMIKTGKPDFPFMVCWANETWYKKMWNKDGTMSQTESKLIAEQQYNGMDDYSDFFFEMLPAFNDSRYIKIDDKPAFMIYKPLDFPEVKKFVSLWQKLAIENGLKGIYFIGHTVQLYKEKKELFDTGIDSVQVNYNGRYFRIQSLFRRMVEKAIRIIFNIPKMGTYKKASKYYVTDESREENVFPTIVPRWDNTPRAGKKGDVLLNSTPDLFEKHLLKVKDVIKDKPEDKRVAFIMAWNEWGEGNYIEPDRRYGTQYLERLKKVFSE
jgi:hypothetical protein